MRASDGCFASLCPRVAHAGRSALTTCVILNGSGTLEAQEEALVLGPLFFGEPANSILSQIS